nr:hypothetical protein Iba_chr13fCG7580 [Ipomoea batatas]
MEMFGHFSEAERLNCRPGEDNYGGLTLKSQVYKIRSKKKATIVDQGIASGSQFTLTCRPARVRQHLPVHHRPNLIRPYWLLLTSQFAVCSHGR